jgi:hypothetical protein
MYCVEGEAGYELFIILNHMREVHNIKSTWLFRLRNLKVVAAHAYWFTQQNI